MYNITSNTQLMTKILLLLNLDISKQFLYMSCNAMEPLILGSHQIQLTKLNFSKHQKIIHFEFNTIRRLKGLMGKVIILYKIN